MASTSPPYTNGLTLNHEEQIPYSTPIFRPTVANRRTPSLSSESSFESSSLFSFNDIESYSPRTPLKFKGIPFSWEQIPGIPKHSKNDKTKEYSEHLLPLPPAGSSISAKKSHHHHHSTNRRSDPFFAALVECSKDDNASYDHDANLGSVVGSKSTRSLSDRFGFINVYAASCKRTCAVSESIVCVPRSSTPHDYVVYRPRRSS